MKEYQRLSDAVVNYQKDHIASLTQKAVKAEGDIQDIMENGFINGMSIVEEKMKKGKIFIPEVLMAAKTAKIGMDTLIHSQKPRDLDLNRGTVVIGSVKGDLHQFGKAIVSLMCEYTGLEVIDIGEELDAVQFVEKVKKHHADVVCLTSFFFPVNLPSTMVEIEKIVKAIKELSHKKETKILIASEWLSSAFINKIGAHAHAATAVNAVSKAQDMLSL